MRKSLIKMTLLSVFIVAGFLFASQAKAAAATLCGVLAPAPSGNCENGQDYTTCTVVTGTYPNCGSGATSDQLKNQLINHINSFAGGSYFQQRGAMYIEDTIGGCTINYTPCSGWNGVINQSSVTLSVQNYTYDKNTAYNTVSKEDIRYADTNTRLSLVIKVNGVIKYAIKLDCGNPVGDLSMPPPNKIPIGSIWLTCTEYSVDGYDPDHSSSSVNFRIRYDTSSGGVKLPIPPSTLQTSRYDSSIRSANFTPGRMYVLQIRDLDDGNWYSVDQHSPSGCASPNRCTTMQTVNDQGTFATPGRSNNSSNTLVKVTDSSGKLLVGSAGATASADGTTYYDYLRIGKNSSAGPWSYTPWGKTVTVSVIRIYHNLNGNWYTYSTLGSGGPYDCYGASCTVTSVVSDDPSGLVVAGVPYTVNATITNTGTSFAQLNLPSSLGGNSLSLTDNGSAHPTNFGLLYGQTRPMSYRLTAPPGGPSTQTVNPYPDYYGRFALGSVCPVNVNVYQQFGAAGVGHSELLPTKENPNRDNYYTRVDISGTSYAVNLTTNSKLNKNGGGALVSNSGGQYSGSTYTLGGSAAGADYPVSSVTAGDQYCASVRIYPTSGYVGPDHNVVGGTGDQTWSSCDKVTNEPYFKVVGGGASAGGNFGSSGSCSGGGLLAGWNNNTNGVDRGAGSQLSALALIKITGFASAQMSINSSPTGLTFSNTQAADITSSLDSPSLGGNFNPGGSVCLPDVTAKSGTVTKTGPYSQPGISGISNSRSVFVNGDARITGNITYSNGWTLGHVPSFVLHATGNIYINPGVTQLDGLYISNKKIYTCGNGFTPMPSTSMYANCKNQLVIHGSFIANQINLMRTFGSLRDETPTAPPPVPSVTKNGKDYYSCGPYSPGTYPCTNDGNSVFAYQEYASTYSLVGLSAASDYKLTLNYKNYQGNWPLPSGLDPPYNYVIEVDVNGVKRGSDLALPANGSSFTVDLGALPANPSITIKWKNNYYGTDIGFVPWGGNQYAYDPNFEINSLSVDSPVSLGPTAHVASPCSNAGTQLITSTCAAEIFQFSPELYLSAPDIQPPSNGATQYDAITSLPPVL